MILGIGTDIASVKRFSQGKVHIDTLAKKILTDFEFNEYIQSGDNRDRYIAKRWAAKEAISKALGTGIFGNTKWKSIEVRHNSLGKPIVHFHSALKNTVDNLNAHCHLSISDDNDTVIAYSIIEYTADIL